MDDKDADRRSTERGVQECHDARHAELRAQIQAALHECEQGLSAPLDIEAIQAELLAELDEFGRPKKQSI